MAIFSVVVGSAAILFGLKTLGHDPIARLVVIILGLAVIALGIASLAGAS